MAEIILEEGDLFSSSKPIDFLTEPVYGLRVRGNSFLVSISENEINMCMSSNVPDKFPSKSLQFKILSSRQELPSELRELFRAVQVSHFE